MHSVSNRTTFSSLFASILVAQLIVISTTSRAQGNTATGAGALYLNGGTYNTADGYNALFLNGGSNPGSYNTAVGASALYNNSGNVAANGSYNTAVGSNALNQNYTGQGNTALGSQCLSGNSEGNDNTASGFYSLFSNTNGSNNTAYGYGALGSNTTGIYNTATGSSALNSNTGNYNTANGGLALEFNTGGTYNTASGYGALCLNTTGPCNTATGYDALYYNKGGSDNVAVGFYAGLRITGGGNTVLGYAAGQYITGSNNIDIGNSGATADNGIIRIGTAGTQKQSYIAGITGVGVTGAAVYVTTSGQLGVLKSSRRFKYDIQDIGMESERLKDLRPVKFRYKEATDDGSHPLQYGLIAEEVAKVYPEMVQYDKQGKPFTVYYHMLTPVMLDQLLKTHHQLEDQQTQISALQLAIQHLVSANQTQSHTLQSKLSSSQRTGGMLPLVAASLLFGGIMGCTCAFAGRSPRTQFSRLRQMGSRSS
jgi:hypothetical protein